MALGSVMLDLEGPELTARDREVLAHPLVGGVILFQRNYVDRAQLSALTAEIHGLRQPPLLVAVDHEGGRVQRFREAFCALPPAAAYGEAFDENADAGLELARDGGTVMALELRTLGIDFSFAPVLDLRNSAGSVIGNRGFHRDPAVVSRLAQAFMRGMHGAGMAAVGKHFPGHGGVAEDSHEELPVDPRSYYELASRDLVPFRTLVEAGVDAIMPAHVLYTQVDAEPAGFSKLWLDKILRQDLGYQGAVLSDDLSMGGAVGAGSMSERAERALAAGCDMVLVCNDRGGAESVIAALPHETRPVSQIRLMRLHGRKPPCDERERTEAQHWRQMAERVAALNEQGELDLDDERLA
ncbi:MAG: beta-N-acetylhexosaminidase [Gammaproteobacteria bacterium]|nr:beta-N-acetylhexosaminidase [Gammaproteobacteria bacterium]